MQYGRVAELVDALDSKSCDLRVVRVQVPPRPPSNRKYWRVTPSQKSWVEPMRNWLNLLGSICKIAKSNDLLAKKQLALDLFGLNLFLINQTPILTSYHNDKRAGELNEKSLEMVGDRGVEPLTSSTSKTRSSQLS